MAKKTPRARDVRFKNRPVSPSRPSTPRASRPDPDDDETDSPSVSAAPSAPVPWFKSPNVVVPIVLAAGLGGVGWWAWHETRGATPTAVTQSDGGTTADASEPTAVADASAAPSQAPAPTPAPTPAAQGDGAALNGDPVEATHPRPTTPDPVHGEFPLAAAQQGISGTGPLVADIETSMGRFTCELLSAQAPITVANFVGLARGTRPWWDPVAGDWVRRPYYDGSIFHRVIPGFMVQGGDVLRTGMGGPGYEFADENVQGHNAAGQLCMANHGPNTNGGQFFITETARAHLDGTYSIFGTCTPTDLVARITGVERDANDRPRVPVFIQHVTIRHAH